MYKTFFALCLICVLLVGCTGVFPGFKTAETYDRDTLNGYVDAYLEAMIAHDTGRLPLSRSVRYTENGQTLKLGDGMWGPVDGIGEYKLYFTDTKTGQVGFFGLVEENGLPAFLALRLKIEKRKISEIEAIIARPEHEVFGEPEGLVDKPIFNTVLAPSERRSRREMIAIADSYFEGLVQATAELTPFDPNCTRVENGVICANSPGGMSPIHELSCGDQFATGFSKFITDIRDRRFPIVDEERGLVYATVLFEHAGIVKTVKMTNGETLVVPPPFNTPYTLLIGELFKIIDGKIHYIEAVLLPVPYGMPCGWDL